VKIAPTIILILISIFTCFKFVYAQEEAEAKVTIKIIDESGNSIPEAKIIIGFFSNYKPDLAPGKIGTTDSNGIFSASGKTYGDIVYSITKNGYYKYTDLYRGWLGNRNAKINKGKWEPWNPTINVVLKKIINPVPMYAKSVETVIPEMDKPVGYDLEKGDWIKPYGKGEISDFFFNFSGYFKSDLDQEEKLNIKFNNPNDGIQEFIIQNLYYEQPSNNYPWPYLAPEKDYKNELELWQYFRNEEQKVYKITGKNYIFRVRSKLDENSWRFQFRFQ
jgi:hypothetical protein